MKRQAVRDIVEHYGLQRDESLEFNWLLQQNTYFNAYGVDKELCPVRLSNPLFLCPHKFAHKYDSKIATDEFYNEYLNLLGQSNILKLFDPVYYMNKRAPVTFILVDTMVDYYDLVNLQALINPTIQLARPGSALTPGSSKEVSKRLNSSNLVNYLVYKASYKESDVIHELISNSFNTRGRLILAGTELPFLNLESICTVVKYKEDSNGKLRAFMRTLPHESQSPLKEIGNRRVLEALK